MRACGGGELSQQALLPDYFLGAQYHTVLRFHDNDCTVQSSEGQGSFSIRNLLGLLPTAKYQQEMKGFRGVEPSAGIDSIIADLYFTLPFDLGIIDGRKRLINAKDHFQGEIEDYGKIFVGTPYEVDSEASTDAGMTTEYLRLIGEVRATEGG